MNKYIESAEKKIIESRKAETAAERNACTISAFNDISFGICSAIFPLNDLMLPLVAAVLSQYNDMLNKHMNADQKKVCKTAKDMLTELAMKTEIKFPRKEQ